LHEEELPPDDESWTWSEFLTKAQMTLRQPEISGPRRSRTIGYKPLKGIKRRRSSSGHVSPGDRLGPKIYVNPKSL
jgi:hypothetical protein